MTTGKLLDVAKNCANINEDWSCSSCELKDDLYCRDKVISGLLNLVKVNNICKWHDLRENPYDVPKLFDRVLTVDNKGIYRVSAYGYFDKLNDLVRDFVYSGIIAWKEITPFEVKE